ncbi:MAG: flavin reductase family protein [Candidatus Brockarchaeota archaeon]|nr:flavin reductase family protein [Candidatus Brockarchaeota archaeon]
MKKEIDLIDSYKLLHPRPVVLICAKGKGEKVNVMSCSWITPVSDDPPVIAISLWKEGYTHTLIDETGEFTVNIPSSKLLEQVWVAGVKSGSKVDKIKLLKLNLVASDTVNVPRIEECLGTLECKVKNRIEIGEQILYIAEVKKALADKTYFKKDIWTDEAELLLHCAGKTFSIPKLIKNKS